MVKSRRTGLSISPNEKIPTWIVLVVAVAILAAAVVVGLYNYYQPADSLPVASETQVDSAERTEKTTTKSQSDDVETEAVSIPASQPVTMTIPSADVQAAPIVSVGIDSSGEMAAPATNHQVGWYDQSANPSQSGGAMLFDGHVGLSDQPAVFKHLHQLKPGNLIEVKTHDGSVHQYKVYHVEQMPLEKVDMRKMMRSVDPSKQGLNIITCAGKYDSSRATYDDRVLVYAVRQT